MAKGVNKVSLLGNVGRVEVSFSGGLSIANVSLATNERAKDDSGNWTDVAEWHNLVFFGKLADIVREYVSKGSKIYVEGRLRTRSWEAKDASGKRYKTEIVAGEVVLLGGKASAGDQEYSQGSAGDDHSQITDEDIPF
jgi:single-strand DNA-binding protein